MMNLLLLAILLLVTILATMLFAIPTRCGYTHRTRIRGTAADIFLRIRYQRWLALWSSWVEHHPESGAGCYTSGTEGEAGSEFHYVNHKGQRGGSQVLHRMVPDQRIEIVLNNPGPRNFQPLLTYDLNDLGNGEIEVTQTYTAIHPRPFNLLLTLLGIRKAVLHYHQRDIQLLKRLVETGEAVKQYRELHPEWTPVQPIGKPIAA